MRKVVSRSIIGWSLCVAALVEPWSALAQTSGSSDQTPHVRRRALPSAQSKENIPPKQTTPAVLKPSVEAAPQECLPQENLPALPASLPPSVPRQVAPPSYPALPPAQVGAAGQASPGSSVQQPHALHSEASSTKPGPSQLRLTTSQAAMQLGTPQTSLPALNSTTPSSLRDDHRLITKSPRVQVVMDGPEQVAIGVAQSYKVVVYNNEATSISGLVLQVEIPPGIQAMSQTPTHGLCETENLSSSNRDHDGSILSWSIESLNQGEQAVLPLEVTALSTSDFNLSVEWTFQPFAAAAPVRVLAPKLELALEGPSDAVYGEPCAYRLSLRNPGNADAHNITVQLSAEQYGSNSTTIGRIAAGGRESMDVELVFHQSGPITVSAQASAANNLVSSSQVKVMVREAQLDLAIRAPEMAYHGTAFPMVIQVRNTGSAPARSLQASITLPAHTKLLSPPAQASIQGNQVVWNINELNPNSETDLTLQVALQNEGANEVMVECATSTGGSIARGVLVDVQTVADLKLLVSKPVAPAPVGREVKYELTLINQGSRVAEQVSVVALFSKDIEPVSAEGSGAKLFPGQVQFDTIDRIPPGESIKLNVYAVAELGGMHRFRAEVHALDSEIKLVQEETTQYMSK